MEFALSELLWVGVVPCAAAAALMLLSGWVSLRPPPAWALSVGGGWLIGQLGLKARIGWSSAIDALWRPHEAADWLIVAVLLATGIGVLAELAPRGWRRWIAALAGVLLLAVPLRLLARSVFVTRWSVGIKLVALFLWAGMLAALWCLLAAGRANRQPLVRGGLLIVAAAGMAVTITFSAAFTYGERCGVVAAAVIGAFLGEAICRRLGVWDVAANEPPDGLSGAAGPLAVMLGGLILLAHFYADLTAANAALLALAVAAAAGWLPLHWLARPTWQAAARATLCLVPLAVAAFSAWAAAAANSAANPYR